MLDGDEGIISDGTAAPEVQKQKRRKPRRMVPQTRSSAIEKLDGRLKEARLLKHVTDELTAHVGGKPTVTQKALISRAAMLHLHITLLDSLALRTGTMLDSDSRTYLAWSNSYARTIALLGVEAAAPKPQSLADLLGDMADEDPAPPAPKRPRGRPRKHPLPGDAP